MAKTMAEKQWDAAYKVAGVAIENELFIYETSSDQWISLVNHSEVTPTQDWINLYANKGFDIVDVTAVSFCVRKRSLIKVGA
jgi:thiaminase